MTTEAPARFELGSTRMTIGVAQLVDQGKLDPMQLLSRHQSGDWGEVDAEDAAENELSLREGFRLLSAYTVNAVKVWVITEHDRSATTVLLPDEY